MNVNKTVSDFSESTIRRCGTETHNYSIDVMKRAAFIDEINSFLPFLENSVAKDIIVDYLKIRIDEINKRYK